MELVDTYDLGSYKATCAGSIPVTRTNNKIMEFKEALKQYQNFRSFLGDYFDCGELWYNLIDHTDCIWGEWPNSGFGWSEPDDNDPLPGDDDFEFMYGAELYGTSRWEKNGYVLFVGDDGCGNRDMYLFDNNKKVDEEDYD